MRSWYYLRGFKNAGEITSAGTWPIRVIVPDIHKCKVTVTASEGVMISAAAWVKRDLCAEVEFDQGKFQLKYVLPAGRKGSQSPGRELSYNSFHFTGGTICCLPCYDLAAIIRLQIPSGTRFTLQNNCLSKAVRVRCLPGRLSMLN